MKKSIKKTGREKRAAFFTRLAERQKPAENTRIQTDNGKNNTGAQEGDDGYLIRCPKCGRMVDRGRVAKRKYICYECESYFRVKVPNRIRMVADPHTFEPWFTDMPMRNPLEYVLL